MSIEEHMSDLLLECKELMAKKGRDYTNGSPNALANFDKTSEETEVTPEKVWYIFAQKHWCAIQSYIKNGQNESEPIHERIKDLINYLILLDYMHERG